MIDQKHNKSVADLRRALNTNEKLEVAVYLLVDALRDPAIFDNNMLANLHTMQIAITSELKYRRDKGIQ